MNNKRTAYEYLIFSSLCFIGDYLFMIGLPLYLAKSSGNIFTASLYLIIISISVLLMKKPENKLSKKMNPFVLVGIVEIVMALIEIFLFFSIKKGINNFQILVIFFFLACIYNLSVPTKRYVLYKYFFPKEDNQSLSLTQGVLEKFSFVISFLISGYLVDSYGFGYILAYDILTFLFLGIYFLTKRNRYYSSEKEEIKVATQIVENNTNKKILNSILPFATITVICSALSRLGHVVIMNKTGISATESTIVFVIIYVTGILTTAITRKNKIWTKSNYAYKYLVILLGALSVFSILIPTLAEVIFLIDIYVTSIILTASLHIVRDLTNTLKEYATANSIGMNFNMLVSIIGIFYYGINSYLIDNNSYIIVNSIIAIFSFITVYKISTLKV